MRPLRSLVHVALAVVAVAAAALLVVPRALGWQGVAVLTGSMEPALGAGGVAFVERVRPDDVRVGDIVAFTRPGSSQQVTHRVVGVTATAEGPRFRTKGDANDIADDWVVQPAQLVGKVRLAIPYLGGIDRGHLAFFMALPAAYLAYDDVRRRRGRQKEATWAEILAVALVARQRRRRVRVTRTS